MAKPLANGVPIGAILTSEKVGELIKLGITTSVNCFIYEAYPSTFR
jgi:acetylornithine/succinyldiaminopimelate/putrescine aminotransferase